MLKTKLRFKGKNMDIEFPCTEQILREKLDVLYQPENLFEQLVVQEVNEPEWLKVLEKQAVSMDQLNYLAKRLDVLRDNQLKQYESAMKHRELTEIKDLINLTFNLSKYTLIENMGDAEKGVVTEHGMLFENDEVEYAEVYNGRTFPQFIYEDCLAVVEMKYGEDTEYVYLPCDDMEIFKAQMRLNVFYISSCENKILDTTLEGRRKTRFEDALVKDGLYAANALANAIKQLSVATNDNDMVVYEEENVAQTIVGP